MGDTTSSLNKSDEYKKIISCTGCHDEFKPGDYIFLCKTGHSVCRLCNTKLRNCTQCNNENVMTRNFALEDIIRLVDSTDSSSSEASFAKNVSLSYSTAPSAPSVDEDVFWKKCSNKKYPSNAMIAGSDSDGTHLYVGRIYHEGSLIPGKINPRHGKLYISRYGRELSFTGDYEILCGVPGQWVECSGNKIPPNAFPGGVQDDGEVIHIGRMKHRSSLQIGHVVPSRGVCHSSYGGSAISYNDYEILIVPQSIDTSEEYMKAKKVQSSFSATGSTAFNRCWVRFTGKIPSGAVQGGMDEGNVPLYIGRAVHDNCLIPGKINFHHKKCFVAYAGAEHEKHDFEVLCNVQGNWVACNGTNVPQSAYSAGKNKDGETLYIGRVKYGNTVTIGKVQKSHGVCYISYGGSEKSFKNYEIFIAVGL